MVSAPATASVQRQVKFITITNNNTASVQVKIQMNFSTVIRLLCTVTIDPSDTLQYTDSEGFTILSYNSGIKTLGANNLNITLGNSTVSSGQFILSNSNSVSFGLSGATTTTATTANVPQQLTITGSIQRKISMSAFESPNAKFSANSAVVSSAAAVGNVSLQRFLLPYDMTATRLDLFASLTVQNATNGTWSISVGFYTRTGSTLGTLYTTNSGLAFGSGGTTNQATNYSGISGMRIRSFSLGVAPNSTWAFTPGEYWFGCINSATAQGASTAQVTIMGMSTFPIIGTPGGDNDNNGGWGFFTASTGAFPSTINITNGIFYCGTVSNASNAMRQPYFRMYGTYG